MGTAGVRSRGWTRRAFLKAGGVLIVGATSLGALALTAGTPTTRSSRPSASASPVPVARRRYRSRPDLSSAPVAVAAPTGAMAPGLVFLTPNNGLAPDGLLIADNAGKPIWIRPDTGFNAANFRSAEYRGKPVLTWWEGGVNGGYGSGQLVIVDDAYRELARFEAGAGRKADIHEFQITPDQTALILTDGGVPNPPGASPPPFQNWDCVVEAVDIVTGTVLFEWHSADHISPDESVLPQPSATASPKPGSTAAAPTVSPTVSSTPSSTPAGSIAAPVQPVFDSVHVNSIELDRDGNLLVSARNTSTVYKVDRTTGAIRWRLGGKHSDFAMGKGTTFALQHDARRHPDGSITIFDDGVAPGPSRAIVLDVDEVAMTASLIRSYPHPHAKLAMSQGNMQVLPNGNVFVGWGSTGYASEFSAGGELVFDADFSGSVQSYRCFRFPWAGHPMDAPAVAVDPVTNGTAVVYVSWNGATEVTDWQVVSGDDPGGLASIGTFPRTDFETVLAVHPSGGLLAVRALDAHGDVLGTSATVTLQD
jgi:hypothetical protein